MESATQSVPHLYTATMSRGVTPTCQAQPAGTAQRYWVMLSGQHFILFFGFKP